MIFAVVLAAGRSRRMGRNKLLIEDASGVAMVRRVVRACCASAVDGVVVVTGFEGAAVRAAIPEPVRFVEAAGFAGGMSFSLRAGIGALPEGAQGAVVCLGDMPLVEASVIDRLVAAHRPGRAVLPVFGGQRGNPVLWDRAVFAAMLELEGDEGAKRLLERFGAIEVAAQNAGVLTDFDTPESLAVAP